MALGSQGWMGVGLQAAAARPGDTLLLDPCDAAPEGRVQNPPHSPHPHAGLSLPSSGDTGSPASSACCCLWRETRVTPKETLAAEAVSHPLCPPPAPQHPAMGCYSTGCCSRAGSSLSIPAARSASVPAVPGTGAAAAAEPARRSRPEPFPASSESPAHGPASPQHISALFPFALAAEHSSLRTGLCPGTTDPAAGRAQAPSHTTITGTAHDLAPQKVHQDGLTTPKLSSGCKEVWQLCSIPAHWDDGAHWGQQITSAWRYRGCSLVLEPSS